MGTPTYVGIDVSKAQLDVALLPSAECWSEPNDESGRAWCACATLPNFFRLSRKGRSGVSHPCRPGGTTSRQRQVAPGTLAP